MAYRRARTPPAGWVDPTRSSLTSTSQAFLEAGDEAAKAAQARDAQRDAMELDLSPESSEHGDPPDGWDPDVFWDLADDAADEAAVETDEEMSDLEAAERAADAPAVGTAEAQELDAVAEYSDGATTHSVTPTAMAARPTARSERAVGR